MRILLAITVAAALAFAGHANAQDIHPDHSPSNPRHWYPAECCHENDCAPVDHTESVKGGRWTLDDNEAWPSIRSG